MADFQWAYDYKPKSEPDYQTGFDPRKFRESAFTGDQTFTKVWGKPGSDPFQISATKSFDTTEEKEIERTFDVVRVKDPDNEDNHVDMEVLTNLKTKNAVDGSRTSISMDRVKPSESVEILQRDQKRTSGDT